MNTTRRRINYAMLGLLVIFALWADLVACQGMSYAENAVGDLGIRSDLLKELPLIETYDRRDASIFVFGDAQRKLQVEKIEGIDPKSADALMNGEIISIEALYANALSAYPGEVSDVIVCNENYKPVFKEKEVQGQVYKYYLLYGTERFGLGACTADTVRYKHVIGWIYCPENSILFIMKYFTPLETEFDELENFILTCSCEDGSGADG